MGVTEGKLLESSDTVTDSEVIVTIEGDDKLLGATEVKIRTEAGIEKGIRKLEVRFRRFVGNVPPESVQCISRHAHRKFSDPQELIREVRVSCLNPGDVSTAGSAIDKADSVGIRGVGSAINPLVTDGSVEVGQSLPQGTASKGLVNFWVHPEYLKKEESDRCIKYPTVYKCNGKACCKCKSGDHGAVVCPKRVDKLDADKLRRQN